MEATLQDGLETIYRIDDSLPVSSFRVTDEMRRALGMGFLEGHREALVVREDEDCTHLSLYISDTVLRDAKKFSQAARSLSPCLSHLDAFCAALEGISHFVYFTFCGQKQDRPVSHMELELQAEIDKFLLLRVILELPSDVLLPRLYEGFELRASVDAEQRQRYVMANRAGRRYARWLSQEFQRGRGARALDDARRLYRSPLERKLERIARAA